MKCAWCGQSITDKYVNVKVGRPEDCYHTRCADAFLEAHRRVMKLKAEADRQASAVSWGNVDNEGQE